MNSSKRVVMRCFGLNYNAVFVYSTTGSQMKSTQERRGGNIRGLPALKNLLISIFSQGVRASEVITSLLLHRSPCHQAAKVDSFSQKVLKLIQSCLCFIFHRFLLHFWCCISDLLLGECLWHHPEVYRDYVLENVLEEQRIHVSYCISSPSHSYWWMWAWKLFNYV